MISIDDFLRIDLRVAKILTAEFIAGADKLLKLRIDVGELGERELFAGIRAAYDPQTLVGRLIVVVANLEPRKMRFGTSEGMMLAAGPGGKDIFVLSPDSGRHPACASNDMSNAAAPDLAARIDALLPQTQCTRCGYSGASPYAAAVAGARRKSTNARPAVRRRSLHWRNFCTGRPAPESDAWRRIAAADCLDR